MKSIIIKRVSEKLGIHIDDVKYVFDAIFIEIGIVLSEKTNISIKGFGKFMIRFKPSFKKKFMGKYIETKPKYYIDFSPSLKIKCDLNEGFL